MIKAICVCIFLIFVVNSNISSQDTVKAKIAVLHKYGDEYNALKNKDRVRAGEMIRVFVQPADESYVYVIYSDDKEASLLYRNNMIQKNEPLILPDQNDYYVFDNNSSTAGITVFCSFKLIKEIDDLFKKDDAVNVAKWDELETKLLTAQRKLLTDKTDKPFPIAGKVSAINENFLDQLQVFVGKNMLIRKYELEIKK